jgi:HEAT repeat protein
MTSRTDTAGIDEILRALVRGGDLVAIPQLLVRGWPAFDRLVQLMTGEVKLGVVTDQRDEEPAISGAFRAFALQDIERVLAVVDARRWGEVSGVLWALRDIAHPGVLALLLRAAASESPYLRKIAVEGLASQRDPLVIAALIKALRDRSSDVRAAAIEALGELRDPAALEPLRALSAKKSAQTDYLAGLCKKAIAACGSRRRGAPGDAAALRVVSRAVEVCFPNAKRAKAAKSVAQYDGPDRQRVILAVLALTPFGSLDALATHVAAAQRDYRELLRRAEDPSDAGLPRMDRVTRYWLMGAGVPSSLLVDRPAMQPEKSDA